MDLQDQLRGQARVAQGLAAAHHCDLDDVGGRALDRRVHGQPLAEGARAPLARAQLRDAPAAPEQRGHVAVLGRPLDRRPHEVAHLREARQVALDELARLVLGDVQPVGEPERGEPVDDSEVDHLGLRPEPGVDVLRRDPEHLRRGGRVHVLAAGEDLLEHLLAADVREDSQLHLRVVGRDQPVAVLGHEAGPDLAAQLGPDRDVLEVWVGARQPARGGGRLVEGGVEPAALVHELGQRVHVGALELGQLPPGLDLLHDLVLAADRLKDARVC